MATLYAGPGKVYFNSVGLHPQGENGEISININEERADIATALFGKVGQNLIDQTAEIVTTPFDHWGLLATLFPARIGATVGATPAALAIGGRPHTAANVPARVWTADGRLYNAVRAAIVGHPTLHLGIGKPLFDAVRLSCLGDPAVAMGGSGYIFAANAITESAAADPGGAFAMTDFIRGEWTGAWGSHAGFGGDAGDPIRAEDEWTIENDIRYSVLKVQGRSLAMKLDSVSFMARVKPYGPTHTQILTRVFAHTHGQRLGSADLTLTGPSSKTITLENAEIVGAGFKFGGTTLGTNEIGFVNEMSFSAGTPTALITFSA